MLRESLAVIKSLSACSAVVAYVLTSQAHAQAVLNSPADGSVLTGSDVTFAWTSRYNYCYQGTLDITDGSGASVYSWADPDTRQNKAYTHDATGLPVDGQPLYIYATCSETGNSVSASYTAFTYEEPEPDPDPDPDTDPDTDSETVGTVVLADGAIVALSPDSVLSVDSGLTTEQYNQVVIAILLTLSTAIGLRQLLKLFA